MTVVEVPDVRAILPRVAYVAAALRRDLPDSAANAEKLGAGPPVRPTPQPRLISRRLRGSRK